MFEYSRECMMSDVQINYVSLLTLKKNTDEKSILASYILAILDIQIPNLTKWLHWNSLWIICLILFRGCHYFTWKNEPRVLKQGRFMLECHLPAWTMPLNYFRKLLGKINRKKYLMRFKYIRIKETVDYFEGWFCLIKRCGKLKQVEGEGWSTWKRNRSNAKPFVLLTFKKEAMNTRAIYTVWYSRFGSG